MMRLHVSAILTLFLVAALLGGCTRQDASETTAANVVAVEEGITQEEAEALIDALAEASGGSVDAMLTRRAEIESAVSSLVDIKSLMTAEAEGYWTKVQLANQSMADTPIYLSMSMEVDPIVAGMDEIVAELTAMTPDEAFGAAWGLLGGAQDSQSDFTLTGLVASEALVNLLHPMWQEGSTVSVEGPDTIVVTYPDEGFAPSYWPTLGEWSGVYKVAKDEDGWVITGRTDAGDYHIERSLAYIDALSAEPLEADIEASLNEDAYAPYDVLWVGQDSHDTWWMVARVTSTLLDEPAYSYVIGYRDAVGEWVRNGEGQVFSSPDSVVVGLNDEWLDVVPAEIVKDAKAHGVEFQVSPGEYL